MQARYVTVIDHGAGNVRSVAGALEAVGSTVKVTCDPREIEAARCVVLPGVGSFRSAMTRLRDQEIDLALLRAVDAGATILGICLGMQLLCQWSDEDGGSEGLGLVPATASKFVGGEGQGVLRIPHVGFNSVVASTGSALFVGVPTNSDFYFVHSYRVPAVDPCADLQIAETPYGDEFVSAFECRRQIYGVQFHPELSQINGLRVLKNFVGSGQC